MKSTCGDSLRIASGRVAGVTIFDNRSCRSWTTYVETPGRPHRNISGCFQSLEFRKTPTNDRAKQCSRIRAYSCYLRV
ncbi:hypothetical protein Y032_0072g666 [Ancylostoma ceylanicum]|uniref:Uncharacterized protein n=1 Tax=Ancylostoma ceylanicum TaxID=53326 RepID=A0A016TWU2_9BILA|nr:hypothetical protein Y032_0072g666 [Ancylostoma ceylanicum]